MSYGLFFWGAFVAAVLWLLGLGWRRGVAPWGWAMLLLTAVVFGLLGSRVASWSAADWLRVFRGNTLQLPWAKSWFGGLVMASLVVYVARRQLGLPRATLDWLVVPAFVGMALGRVGCLAGGCCLGLPTRLPWAMHRVNGVGVHPVPVYEMLFAALLVTTFALLRKKMLRSGQPFALALAAYFGFRFLEEFVRPGLPVLAGLNGTQWAALVLLVFWIRQFVSNSVLEKEPLARVRVAPSLALLVGFAAGYGLFLASPLERLVLGTVFAVVLSVTAVRVWVFDRWQTSVAWPAVPLVFALFALGLRFPALDDTLKNVERSWRVGFGGDFGRYEETCGGMHNVQLGAVKVERVLREAGGLEGRAGIQVYAGVDESTTERSDLFVVNPYVALDSRWVGVAGGAHIGNLVVDGRHQTRPLASVGLRLGPRSLLFAHAGVGETFPGGAPIPGFRLGLGFGLGELGQFRFGVGFTGWYAEPRFRLPSGVEILARGAAAEGTYEFGFGISLPFARRTQ